MKLRRKGNVLVVLIVLMFMLTCACGGDKGSDTNVENEKPNSESSQVVTEKIEQEEPVVGEKEDSILVGTYKVPRKDMYVDIPDMHYIESGYTQVWFEDQVKYVAFTFLKNETAEDETNAWDVTLESLKKNMSGLHYINNLGEVTEEYTSINGIDVYSFEGKINCGETVNYDAYVKGYSFIYDEMPCSIIGVVMDEEQPQDQIDAIKEIVDAMILTVRSEQ